MKKILILFFLVSLGFYSFGQQRITPNEKCQFIYVWEFQDYSKNRNDVTHTLTNAVEEALVKLNECVVLERNMLASLMPHINDASGVDKISEIDFKKKQFLLGKNAKAVLFGSVNLSDNNSYIVHIKLSSLSDAHLIAENSINILPSDLKNVERMNMTINKLVYGLIGKELVSSDLKNTASIPVESGGYRFEQTGCYGDLHNQTVSITFTMVNIGNPNQIIRFVEGYYGGNHAKAGDELGREYALKTVAVGGQPLGQYFYNVSRDLRTGSTLQVTVVYANVLPSVKRLTFAKVPIATKVDGAVASDYSTITLDATDIKWQ